MALGQNWEALCVAKERSVGEHQATHRLGEPSRLDTLLRELTRDLKGCRNIWRQLWGKSDSAREKMVYVLCSRSKWLERICLL